MDAEHWYARLVGQINADLDRQIARAVEVEMQRVRQSLARARKAREAREAAKDGDA